MPPDVWTSVASIFRARHYAKIAKALRAGGYDARSMRGRQGIRCIRVAVPDTHLWAWWGSSTAWDATTALGTWAGVLYHGSGQIAQVGELLTDILSNETDAEKIAEGIAIRIDEAEIEACCDKWWE